MALTSGHGKEGAFCPGRQPLLAHIGSYLHLLGQIIDL